MSNQEEHKKIHVKLHQSLNELVADWIEQTEAFPSSITVLELMQWSHAQTEYPTGQAPELNVQSETEASSTIIRRLREVINTRDTQLKRVWDIVTDRERAIAALSSDAATVNLAKDLAAQMRHSDNLFSRINDTNDELNNALVSCSTQQDHSRNLEVKLHKTQAKFRTFLARCRDMNLVNTDSKGYLDALAVLDDSITTNEVVVPLLPTGDIDIPEDHPARREIAEARQERDRLSTVCDVLRRRVEVAEADLADKADKLDNVEKAAVRHSIACEAQRERAIDAEKALADKAGKLAESMARCAALGVNNAELNQRIETLINTIKEKNDLIINATNEYELLGYMVAAKDPTGCAPAEPVYRLKTKA